MAKRTNTATSPSQSFSSVSFLDDAKDDTEKTMVSVRITKSLQKRFTDAAKLAEDFGKSLVLTNVVQRAMEAAITQVEEMAQANAPALPLPMPAQKQDKKAEAKA